MSRKVPDLSPGLQQGLQEAFHLCRASRHEFITTEHLLLALLDDPAVQSALHACGARHDRLRQDLQGWLHDALERLPDDTPEDHHPDATLGLSRVLERAFVHAASAEARAVTGGDILASVLEEKESQAAYLLKKHGVRRLALLRHLSHGAPAASGPSPDPSPAPQGEEEEGLPADPLASYAVDLVAKAREGRIDPLIGRDAELERMVHVLCRRRKNNPLLVGEAGVGKTALAEGLALRIAEGRVPDVLKDAPFFSLDMGSLLAGTRYRGDFEARIKGVLEALKAKPGALLFIDEIHTLVGAGSTSGGSMDASNLLKPALASGELRCLGATTFQDLKASFDKDKPLSRRFQTIEVLEPSEAETVAILKGLRSHYEKHHGVKYPDAVLEAAARLANRHLRDQQLPDKAIDVIDEAGAAQRLLPKKARAKQLTVAHVEAVIARMARVPVEAVGGDEAQRLGALETDLKTVLFGQDEAVDRVVSAIKLSRSGLRGHERPSGSFLFAGPTGVGKTELARQLAKTLGVGFLRFDMSEYMEKHAVARLIGAPPGYVGFEDGGLLVDAIRRQPHAVLLLDEVEKAHPDLFAILLQVMDHATLTDNHGRKADFRHVVIIMTTNAGARDLSQRRLGFADGTGGTSAKGAIEKLFTPEFRNRLDAIVTFHALGRPEVLKVVDKFLKELEGLLAEKRVTLEVNGPARDWLAAKGYDPAFGARPMARVIESELKRPLADELLFGRLREGGRVKVSVRKDALHLAYS